MKRVYLCSRYAGDTARNEAVAEELCRRVIKAGHAPFAPHIIYTRFLDDQNPSERELDQAFRLGKRVIEIKEV